MLQTIESTGGSLWTPEGAIRPLYQRRLPAEEVQAECRGVAAVATIKAAAVSDYRVAQPADAKLPKGEAPLTLELVPTPDILKEVGAQKGARIVVGFAAETGEVVWWAPGHSAGAGERVED